MPGRIEERARAYGNYALGTIERAAEILETVKAGAPWSAREALAQADRELRDSRHRQGPTFSLIAIENALNTHLQKGEGGKSPATPLDRMAAAPGANEAAARLRLAAPEVAANIEQETLAQEKVLDKLAAANFTDEDIDRAIAEVRGK